MSSAPIALIRALLLLITFPSGVCETIRTRLNAKSLMRRQDDWMERMVDFLGSEWVWVLLEIRDTASRTVVDVPGSFVGA